MKFNYTADSTWSMFEITIMKYHHNAIKIIKKYKSKRLTPKKERLKDFTRKMQLPEDMYRTLLRELYAIARDAKDFEKDVYFKDRMRELPRTSNPIKKYFMAISLANELKDDIWQLDPKYFYGDPTFGIQCPTCESCDCKFCYDKRCPKCKCLQCIDRSCPSPK